MGHFITQQRHWPLFKKNERLFQVLSKCSGEKCAVLAFIFFFLKIIIFQVKSSFLWCPYMISKPCIQFSCYFISITVFPPRWWSSLTPSTATSEGWTCIIFSSRREGFRPSWFLSQSGIGTLDWSEALGVCEGTVCVSCTIDLSGVFLLHWLIRNNVRLTD